MESRSNYPTNEEVLNEIDPEWKRRWWGDVDAATQFYRQYSPERWAEVVKELRE